jgi:hypothetical protein
MYDEPEGKRRWEYVNIGSRSVRTEHMGSTVYSCSREIASVGVEIISKCPLTHPYPAGSPSQCTSRPEILAKFGRFSSTLKAIGQGKSSPSTWTSQHILSPQTFRTLVCPA